MTTRSTVVRVLAVLSLWGLPAATHADGNITLGAQWWTQTAPEAKFQEFREVPRGAVLESFFLRDSAMKSQFTLFAASLTQESQSASLMAALGVRWRVDLGYRQIPHLFSETGRTPFEQLLPGVYLLPDSLQAFLQRNAPKRDTVFIPTMQDLLAHAPGVALGFRTDISEARLRGRPVRGLQIEVRGTRRERSGTKAFGASLGFSDAYELPEPINQRMLDGDVIANYVWDRFTVRASGGVSAFKNRVNALRWDNPRRITDAYGGTSQGQLDLYPDNRVVRGALSLGVNLPRRSVFTANLGVSQGTQDDPWLPITVNQSPEMQDNLNFYNVFLPGTKTDAKATQISQDYRLMSRLVPRLAGTVRFRQYHYDNKTPEYEFNGFVPVDQTVNPTHIESEPFGNKQNVYGADLDLDLVRGVGLSGTYEYRMREHTLREVEDDKENAVTIKARAHPMDAVEVTAGYGFGDRKLDHFNEEAYVSETGAQEEQPGLRRFDVANRRQNTADAGVSWAVGERVDLTVQYAFLQNKYPDSPLGLQEELNHLLTSEATLHATSTLDLSGGYGYGKLTTDQTSRQSSTAVPSAIDTSNWTAELEDQNVFAFAGLTWNPAAKIAVTSEYVYSRAQGEFHLASNFRTNGLFAQDLPKTFYRRHTVSAEARYSLLGNTDITARYGYDQYDITDFSSQGIPLLGLSFNPTTGVSSATSIYLGDNSLSYRAHAVMLAATRRF